MMCKGDSLLIGELKRRYSNHDTADFGVSDFLSAFGSPVDAVMYLRLFWPELVCYEDMVFRQEVLEDDEDRKRVLEALSRYGGDKTETERSFNMVDIPCGVFSRLGHESSDCIDEYLVGKLVELWTHRLRASFPDRSFVVEALLPEENGGERGVVFYTIRGAE